MGILKKKPEAPKSIVKNEPHLKNPILRAIREQLEHRALWMYVLVTEAEKHGLDPEVYARDAIRRCGEYQGAIFKEKGGKGDSFKGLKKALFSIFARMVFEMQIKQLDDDHFYLDFHYCPLVKAWQKAGATDEQISRLCSYAMCGDRGIISQFGGELDLQSTIADGADICKIRFRRTNVDVEPKVKKVK